MNETPKKLLLVSDAWHPQVNGVVTVLSALVKVLEARGWSVTIVHPGLFWSVPLPFYPEVRFALFPGRKLKKIFSTVKPDYVHIAVEWTLGLSARNFCVRRNIPFTTSYHTNFRLYASYYLRSVSSLAAGSADQYMRWFHSGAERTLVSTDTLKQELAGRGYKNLALWHFGVDTEIFKRNLSTTVEPGLPRPIFVYFGRVSMEKSVEEFLKAKLPGSKLVIGDGPLRRTLEKTYMDAKFVGYKKRHELVDWLSACDVCVFPSRTETFGLSILESLACGIPVAAHDVLGPKDIITDGVDGYLSDDLAAAAVKCLSLSSDDCRTKAVRFSWESSVDTFLAQQVAATGPRTQPRTWHLRELLPILEYPTMLRVARTYLPPSWLREKHDK